MNVQRLVSSEQVLTVIAEIWEDPPDLEHCSLVAEAWNEFTRNRTLLSLAWEDPLEIEHSPH